MIFLFYFFLYLILYTYFLYPAVLYLLAKLKPRRVQKYPITPSVSIVMSVCNEEDVIKDKISNLLALGYPRDKIEILIGSDGSKDRTNEFIRSFVDGRIRLFESGQRRGKVATLNEMVGKVKHSIIIFTDARQILAKDSVKELVANFADPEVGCVSGELIFLGMQGTTAQGINLYWEYEKFIRDLESRIHSMIGATGAIYAIRRELYTSPPENVVLDDVFVPLKIVQKGFRAVFDSSARAYDKVAESPREEHTRKTRTLYGNYQIFTMFPSLFNPLKSPLAIQLFSHKFLRLMIPFLMIALFVINLIILNEPGFRLIFGFQILFYGMAVIGALSRHTKYGIFKLLSKLCYVPFIFCLLNYSALVGFVRFVRGNQNVVWDKARKLE